MGWLEPDPDDRLATAAVIKLSMLRRVVQYRFVVTGVGNEKRIYGGISEILPPPKKRIAQNYETIVMTQEITFTAK